MVRLADKIAAPPAPTGVRSPIAPTGSAALGASLVPPSSHALRREILHQLGNFLLDHELDVNPANLALAQEIVAGGNVALNRQIVARQLAGEPVTQAWLDDVASDYARPDPAETREREALDWLTDKLEQALEQLLHNASEASTTAADFSAVLCETATGLEAARPIVELPGLTSLTHVMIERTRTVEAELLRREQDMTALRDTLQTARADAAMDHLTGMNNGRAFDTMLEREQRAARAAGEPLSMALCAIDRLQAITDSHGRETGDRVIQAIARALHRISGRSCHISRHGEEEFALLFRGLAPDAARDRLDTARETFAMRRLIDRKSSVAIGSVTFSGGVADVLAHDDPQAALAAADAALAHAREQGRNRIVVAPS